MSFKVACCVQCMFCTRHSKFVYVPSSLFCCFDVNVHVSEPYIRIFSMVRIRINGLAMIVYSK